MIRLGPTELILLSIICCPFGGLLTIIGIILLAKSRKKQLSNNTEQSAIHIS